MPGLPAIRQAGLGQGCDLDRTLCCRWDISEAETIKMRPFKSGLPAIRQAGLGQGYSGYFLPFLKKGKKCQPSSRELIGLIAAKV